MTHKITINGEQMTLSFQRYHTPKNTRMQIYCANGEPYSHVTTNLDEQLPHDQAYILSTYQDKFIPVPELIDARIITPTEQIAYSGFNTYRVYQILVELCPQCRSTELGYVPMSKVLVKTRKCLKCDYEWSLHND